MSDETKTAVWYLMRCDLLDVDIVEAIPGVERHLHVEMRAWHAGGSIGTYKTPPRGMVGLSPGNLVKSVGDV